MNPGDLVRLSRDLHARHVSLPHPTVRADEGGCMEADGSDVMLVLKVHRFGPGADDATVTLLGPRGVMGLAWIDFLEVVG